MNRSKEIMQFRHNSISYSVFSDGEIWAWGEGGFSTINARQNSLPDYVDDEVERLSAENADIHRAYDQAEHLARSGREFRDKRYDTPLDEIQRLVRKEVKRALNGIKIGISFQPATGK